MYKRIIWFLWPVGASLLWLPVVSTYVLHFPLNFCKLQNACFWGHKRAVGLGRRWCWAKEQKKGGRLSNKKLEHWRLENSNTYEQNLVVFVILFRSYVYSIIWYKRLSFVHRTLCNVYPWTIRNKQIMSVVILLLIFKIIFTIMLLSHYQSL